MADGNNWVQSLLEFISRSFAASTIVLILMALSVIYTLTNFLTTGTARGTFDYIALGVLVLVLLVLITLAVRGLSSGGSGERPEPLPQAAGSKKERDRVFLSAPMSGLHTPDESKRQEFNNAVNLLKDTIKKATGKDVSYGGLGIQTQDDYDDDRVGYEYAQQELDRARGFVLVWPESSCSGSLVELGIAMQMKIPILIVKHTGAKLPYLVLGALEREDRIKEITYTEPDLSDLRKQKPEVWRSRVGQWFGEPAPG